MIVFNFASSALFFSTQRNEDIPSFSLGVARHIREKVSMILFSVIVVCMLLIGIVLCPILKFGMPDSLNREI